MASRNNAFYLFSTKTKESFFCDFTVVLVPGGVKKQKKP